MLIWLIRHGETEYNREKRYQGVGDAPLSGEGRAALHPAGFAAGEVIVSPLLRARETAELLFPGARLTAEDGLREMDFGVFEGRNYAEMEHDADYCAWVEGGCMGRCPGGECHAEFTQRTCEAFARLVDRALREGREMLVIVAHGGTRMAVMERFGLPRRDYFSWGSRPGTGVLLDASLWEQQRQVQLLETRDFTKG